MCKYVHYICLCTSVAADVYNMVIASRWPSGPASLLELVLGKCVNLNARRHHQRLATYGPKGRVVGAVSQFVGYAHQALGRRKPAHTFGDNAVSPPRVAQLQSLLLLL